MTTLPFFDLALGLRLVAPFSYMAIGLLCVANTVYLLIVHHRAVSNSLASPMPSVSINHMPFAAKMSVLHHWWGGSLFPFGIIAHVAKV